MTPSPLNFTREGKGDPLVLVHGYLGGAGMWRGQIDHFKDRYDVIVPNLAGFGDSAHLTAPDSIDAHARMVLDLLVGLDIERFSLLGHSMGGMIVQQMAALAGGRIAKLVCYGTGPLGVLPDRFETIAESRRGLESEGLAPVARRIAATWFRAGEAGPGFEICLAEGAKTSLQAALASLTAWEGWDGRATLPAIACPTLVIWGDGDRSYGWAQPEALWRGIPDSQLAVLPGCAHNAHLEKPDLFNSIVDRFLVGPGL